MVELRTLADAKRHFGAVKDTPLIGHKKSVRSVAWNCTGRILGSGSVDYTARLWDVEAKRKVVELRGHTSAIEQLSWSPTNANLLATASSDKSVRLWDVRNGSCLHTVTTPGGNINVSWHPSGSPLVVGNKADTLSFIDPSKGTILKNVNNNSEINEIRWNLAGNMFYLCKGQGAVMILSYPSLETFRTIRCHTTPNFCIGFAPTGRTFAVGGADALVSIFDNSDLTCVRTMSRHDGQIRSLSYSHDGQFLASGSEDPTLDIMHVESGERVCAVDTSGDIQSVAFHPSRYLLAYAGADARQEGGGLHLLSFGSG
eukprot:TRINITY_DN4856_c0_g1_i1.p1 TRINITY_DN4856_c0_g1~~TRINITY_DN4856_c0_g1_i1.p1  ORF type:complete len:314 (-),score=36.16 TRINITY_DN4856_c0_g1_i1:103-1044(-)